MVRPSERRPLDQAQNDPDETNDPKSSDYGNFDAHIWTSLNQIFESLGKIDQKVDHLTSEQGKLKEAVEKHDKLLMRIGFTVAGAVAVITPFWFLYENFLKDHVTFK